VVRAPDDLPRAVSAVNVSPIWRFMGSARMVSGPRFSERWANYALAHADRLLCVAVLFVIFQTPLIRSKA